MVPADTVWLTAPTWLQRLTIAVELVANPSIVFMASAPPLAACPWTAATRLLPGSPHVPPPTGRPAAIARCAQDEPTSGLDARAASIVMRAVRNIVSSGRTVVCTIHQPSVEIFQVSKCATPVPYICR